MPAEDPNPETIARAISPTAHDLLWIAVEEGGTCNTTDFTSKTGLGNDTVAHHIDYHLYQHDLLEKIGVDESVNIPISPNKYRITDRGRAVVDAHQRPRERDASDTVDRSEELEALRAEVADLEETVAWLTDKVNDHQDTIDFVEERRGR